MEAKTLFDFTTDHLPAALLSLVPALVTLYLITYIYSRFPAYKMTRVYLLFVSSMLLYQLNDVMARVSASEEMARSWDRLLVVAWTILVPSGLHWSLLLLGNRKLANSYRFILPVYFSAFFFSIPVCSGLYLQPFSYSTFWGWVRTYADIHPFLAVTLLWWAGAFTLVLFLLGWFAYQNRRSAEMRFVSLMIFAGYAIPVVIGLITQVTFPLFLKMAPIPIASTLMVTTVVVIIGLNAYKIFNLSETLQSENITELLQESIFVVTAQRNITYINSFGAGLVSKSRKKIHSLQDIFPASNGSCKLFDKQILTPSFTRPEAGSHHFAMENEDGKHVHWEVTTYPLFYKRRLDGLLVVCRDVTDRFDVAEAKLTSLRSQMNPHFIFNSLNAIQHYIHEYRRDEAQSFLTAFSALIRKILVHSTKAYIPLWEELNSIELYLTLEKARFKSKLEYELIISDNLDAGNTMVPPMLIQPYIENAIIHGLANKKEGGKVTIKMCNSNGAMMCSVSDNGVGRVKAAEIEGRIPGRNRSYGMSITAARLDILNRNLNVPVSVNIKDLCSKDGESLGTEVEILIPLNEDY